MSGDGSTTFAWGDGEYKFKLALGELRDLQTNCDAGPYVIYQRLADGSWRVDDIRETIRLGLIGAGMDHTKALGKVGRFVGPGQYLVNVIAARRIMLAALFGDPDDIVEKKTPAIPAETDGSNSASLSEPPPQSVGQSINSTDVHYGNSQRPSTAGTDATVPRMNG